MEARKIIITRIAIWAVVLVVALGSFFIVFGGDRFSQEDSFDESGGVSFFGPFPIFHFGNHGFFGWGGDVVHQGNFQVVNEMTEQMNSSKIKIGWDAGNVTFFKSTDRTCRVVQKAQAGISEQQLFVMKQTGDTLEIHEKADLFKLNRNREVWATDLEVYLPEQEFEHIFVSLLGGDLNAQNIAARDFSVDTVSGDSRVSGTVGTLAIDSTSGNMYVSGIFEEARLDSTSGDLIVNRTKVGKKLVLSSTSGKLSGEGIEAELVNVDTTSGDLNIKGTFGTVKFDTISGNGQMEAASALKRLEFNSTSGDMRVKIPENTGFSVEFDSVSGDFKSDFPTTKNDDLYTYGNGAATYRGDTISGNLEIMKRN